MASEVSCYFNHSSKVGDATGSVPCGVENSTNPYVTCCVTGDFCMSDGICHYVHPLTGGSGYYDADCTDPSYSDVTCPNRCSENPLNDIVYDVATGEWHCCTYDGPLSCSKMGNSTFQAPAPSDLKVLQYIPSHGTPTYNYAAATSTTSSSPSSSSSAGSSSSITSAASQSSSTSVAASASPQAANSSHGLSGGAAAGIGIGVALAVIAIAALAFLFVFRRRRQQRGHGSNELAAPEYRAPAHEKPANEAYPYAAPAYESSTHEKRSAAPTGPVAELPGSSQPMHEQAPPVPLKSSHPLTNSSGRMVGDDGGL